MSRKNRVMWDDRLKERLLTDVLKKLIASNIDMASVEGVAPLIKKSIEEFNAAEDGPSRLSQVLESYRALRGGQAIHAKAINLAQMLAPHLPGERFWLVSPTEERGVCFESELATVEIIVKQSDVADSDIDNH